MEFLKYTLPNGIRCIFKRVKSPVAWCALTINTGSRDEMIPEAGIAHFTEHMLFKGTEKRRAYHINNRLENMGGELNAFTTKEETVVHATTLRGDLSKAAELVSDIVFHSTFKEREVIREKEVVIDEINSYKDSPFDRIYDEFEDLLFSGSNLGHNILGHKATVSKFRQEDIQHFVARCYTTDQMVFSVMADITPRSFINITERYFGNISGSLRSFERNVTEDTGPFEKSIGRRTYQAHCIMGNRAYNSNDPKRIALSLLINVLGGPAANSRLNMLLRERNGLTYNVEAGYTPYSDTGFASIYFGSDKENVEKCIGLIHKELDTLKNTALTSRQLSVAKKQFTGQLAIAMESREGYMLSAAKSYLMYGHVDSPVETYRKIEALTSSELMNAANEVFGGMSVLTYK